VHETLARFEDTLLTELEIVARLDRAMLTLETLRWYFDEDREAWCALRQETGVPRGFFEEMAAALYWRDEVDIRAPTKAAKKRKTTVTVEAA